MSLALFEGNGWMSETRPWHRKGSLLVSLVRLFFFLSTRLNLKKYLVIFPLTFSVPRTSLIQVFPPKYASGMPHSSNDIMSTECNTRVAAFSSIWHNQKINFVRAQLAEVWFAWILKLRHGLWQLHQQWLPFFQCQNLCFWTFLHLK